MNPIKFLKANEHNSNPGFVEKAQHLKDNRNWLKYSYAVAIKVKSRMHQIDLTQKQLAEAMNCTQQHVSILLQGKANMTLETLAKLEEALQMDLIGKALTHFPDSSRAIETPLYLNEPASPEEEVHSGTSSLVDGYKARKKKGPKKA